jgi:hypothetical protein
LLIFSLELAGVLSSKLPPALHAIRISCHTATSAIAGKTIQSFASFVTACTSTALVPSEIVEAAQLSLFGVTDSAVKLAVAMVTCPVPLAERFRSIFVSVPIAPRVGQLPVAAFVTSR